MVDDNQKVGQMGRAILEGCSDAGDVDRTALEDGLDDGLEAWNRDVEPEGVGGASWEGDLSSGDSNEMNP